MDAFASNGRNVMRVQHAAELTCFVTLSVQLCRTQFLDVASRTCTLTNARNSSERWHVGRVLCGWRSLRRSQSHRWPSSDLRLRQNCGDLSNVQLTKHRCQPYFFQDYSQAALIFAIVRWVWSNRGNTLRRRLSRLLTRPWLVMSRFRH